MSVLWSTVWLQSSWESIQGCLFPPVTFTAVSSTIVAFRCTNTYQPSMHYMKRVFQKAVCVCLGSSPMSHLMTRPNRQGDSSSLRGEISFLQKLHLDVSGLTKSICVSLWQTRRGRTGMQASKSWRPRWPRCLLRTAQRTIQVSVIGTRHQKRPSVKKDLIFH